MQTPEYVGSSAARMIIALTVFLTAVTAGVWVVTRPAAEVKNPKQSKEVASLPPETQGFFYDAIGRAPEGESTAAVPATKSSFTLEIKVAKSREEAERLIDDLEAHGIEAYYTPLSRSGQVVYRVRRGMFPTRKEASRAAVALKEQHQVETRVVKLQ